MIGDYKNKQFEIEQVLLHSQDYPFDLNAEALTKQWYEAKRHFIDLFNGETIIRSDEKIKVQLSGDQQARRFVDFLNVLKDNGILSQELETFLYANKAGFFDNKVILPFPSKKIGIGAKISKSFKHFFSDEKTVRWIQDTASRFIQENKVEGYVYLSVDPIDFLTLAENGENWWSCHSLDGDFRGGNLNYMVDDTTVIAYLADEEKKHFRCLPQDMTWYSKKWRMLIHTDMKNCMYFNRQYPYDSDDLMFKAFAMIDKYSNVVFDFPRKRGFKTVMFDSDNQEMLTSNQLTLGGRVYDTRDIIDTTDSLGFNDLISSSLYEPIVSLNIDKRVKYERRKGIFIKQAEDEEFMNMFHMKIGREAICPCCGEDYIESPNSFLCNVCIAENDADEDFFLYCHNCGRRFYEGDEIVFRKDGPFQIPYCAKCDRTIKEEKKENRLWQKKATRQEKP